MTKRGYIAPSEKEKAFFSRWAKSETPKPSQPGQAQAAAATPAQLAHASPTEPAMAPLKSHIIEIDIEEDKEISLRSTLRVGSLAAQGGAVSTAARMVMM